jgi:hypothetical protein
MADVQCGDHSIGHCPLDSMSCLLAVGADFHCTDTKNRCSPRVPRSTVGCRVSLSPLFPGRHSPCEGTPYSRRD